MYVHVYKYRNLSTLNHNHNFVSVSLSLIYFCIVFSMASLKQRCDDDNIGSITKGIKALVESRDVRSVPSEYTFIRNPNNDDEADLNDPDHSIPIIDFSLLTSDSPQQRSKILHDLQKACQEWGFFLLINHGVGESLMKRMIEMCRDFFNMPAEEKPEIISNNKGANRSVLEPIMYGTSFNVAIDKVLLWRDFIKVVTNGKYKSVRHRAVVNNTKTRISIAVPHGPSVDTVVVPLPELLEKEGQSPVYSGMSYKDYIELQQSSKCYMKSSIDMITI
ncbi:hypothetical protein G4B88_031043 [Cannabis sativa]|uniref:Non-haem dioxygenase N-terminal domain-containing protein n=1 Tax=Cannabis sativa TaxID=3483 RepID=A0A7J6FYI4_CANSA|nr:hypothetical protein G4B88_031043 [Cannabis sativa]